MAYSIEDIRSLSIKTHEENFMVELTDFELSRVKDLLAEVRVEQLDDDNEYSGVRVSYTTRKKDRHTQEKSLATTIRSGREERTILVHYVPDYARNRMEIYDDNGKLIDSRRLRAEERQTTIHNIEGRVI